MTEMDPRKHQEAMRVAGGETEPVISRLPKAAADRVLSMEAVMNQAHAILWPDLCDEQSAETDSVDATRAQM